MGILKVNELFSGIGAQRKALERIGIPHEIVGISEIDPYAIKAYEAIHGKTRNYGDIRKVAKLDYADLWTYSSPCQSFSKVGKHAGLQGESGLISEVERLLRAAREEGKQPKYLLLENVPALVGPTFKKDFDRWLEILEELGYETQWKILNARDFGIPQDRRRLFAVSIRKDVVCDFVLPTEDKTCAVKTVYQLMESMLNVPLSKWLIEEQIERLQPWKEQSYIKTLRVGGRNTYSKKHTFDVVKHGEALRHLTAKEFWRFMDFSDEDFERSRAAGLSEHQLYKLAGNSIVVGVLASIFKNLLGE